MSCCDGCYRDEDELDGLMCKDCGPDTDEAYARGAAEERKRIVAWLLRRANSLSLMRSLKSKAIADTLLSYLTLIERGAHAAPAPPGQSS